MAAGQFLKRREPIVPEVRPEFLPKGLGSAKRMPGKAGTVGDQRADLQHDPGEVSVGEQDAPDEIVYVDLRVRGEALEVEAAQGGFRRLPLSDPSLGAVLEIGRASCRERV